MRNVLDIVNEIASIVAAGITVPAAIVTLIGRSRRARPEKGRGTRSDAVDSDE